MPTARRLQIRLLKAGEVGLLRGLRLEALRDAPDQLGEARADSEARSEEKMQLDLALDTPSRKIR